MRWLGIITLLFTLSIQAAESGRAAFVAGRAPHDRRAEYESLQKIYGDRLRFELYDNRELPRLAQQLPEYDAVVFGSLGNLVEPASFTMEREQWRDYLEQGGIVLILGACEVTAYENFLQILETQPSLNSGVCALMGRVDLAPHIRYADTEVMTRPHALADGFQQANFYQWGHLVPSPAWEVLAHCPDQQALIAARPVGKGWIFVVAPAEFAGRGNLLHDLLENIRIFVRNREAAIHWDMLESDGDRPQFRAAWSNHAAQPQQLTGELVLTAADGSVLAQQQFDAAIAPQATHTAAIPAALAPESSGTLTIRLDSPAVWSAALPVARSPWIAMELPRHRIYRYQASRYTIGLRLPDSPGLRGTTPVAVIEPAAPVKVVEQDAGRLVLDWSDCPAGSYSVKVELRRPDRSVLAATRAEPVELDDHVPYMQIDAAQKIRRDGKRFFPIGFYHVSWGLTDADRLACLEYSARNGYNVLHASWRPDEAIDPLVEAARRENVMLFLEGVNPERIRQWQDEKSILGWSLRDEPDLGLVDPAELAAQYELWRDDTPNQLISTVLVFPTSFRNYRRIADWVGHDYYPVLSGNRDLSSVFANHCRLKEDIGEWRAPLAVLQSFGYPAGFAIPTLPELKNMVYQTLAADTSGILFYTWNDGSFALTDHPELEQWMRRLPAEIAPYLPFLLDGSWQRFPSDNPAVVGGGWQLGDRKLRILCNTSRERQSVNADGARKQLEPLEVWITN